MTTLFIITGAPGSGKSTYGAALADERRAAFLDIDTVTETLIRKSMNALGQDPDDRDSPLFKSRFRQAIYDTLFAIAEENLKHVDVVLTGPFTSESKNERWIDELRERFAKNVEAHYVYCPPEERLERITRRANPRDQAKIDNWEDHLKYYGDEERPRYPHAFINTSS